MSINPTAGERFYLGVDAGGTKTHALVADSHGHVLGAGRAGPGNWEGVGLDGAYEAYAAAIDEALSAAGLPRRRLTAAGYALAGLDWESDVARLDGVLSRLDLPGPRSMVNDTFGALRAGSPDGVGIVVIAGTGSTVAGRNRAGQVFRTFGLGRVWGDFSGAAGLTWAATRAIGHAYFGRGPQTALTDMFVAAYGCVSILDMVERVSRNEARYPDGRLAPLVFEAAAQGDAVARAIVREVGEDIGLNVAAITRTLAMAGEAFDVVMAGGVFRSGSAELVEALLAPVRAIAPAAHPVVLSAPPVVGSTLLAFDAAGAGTPPELCARLAEEATVHFEHLL